MYIASICNMLLIRVCLSMQSKNEMVEGDTQEPLAQIQMVHSNSLV